MMFEDDARLAREAAEKAGKFLLKQKATHVKLENGRDIKLDVDEQSEKILIGTLKKSGYPILSEEMGCMEGNHHGCTWIVDPLDGSANYWRGLRELTCVSVALWKGQEPILGVVHNFSRNDTYMGVVGQGAWKNDEVISTSDVSKANRAFLMTGFPVHGDYSQNGLQDFVHFGQKFKKVRMLGTAAMMGCFVAEGKADAYIEKGIMLWDIAASSAIVAAAGGDVDVVPLDNHKCICKLFASRTLKKDYESESL